MTVSPAARDDDDALAALIRAYHDRVLRFGGRVCRDGSDADDAVQEAFIKLARRPEVVRDRGALSWLFTVVRNHCLRLLRRFHRERPLLAAPSAERAVVGADALLAVQLTAAEALERREQVRAVHAALAGLERPFREVIVMRDLEGLSGDETCAALGLSRAAMKTRLHRARSALR